MSRNIYFLVLFLIIAGAVVAYSLTLTLIETPEECAAEGERMRPYDDTFPDACCEGLEPIISNSYYIEECTLQIIGDIMTCVDCGNGICDEQYGEGNCNCPEDCEI